MDAQESQQRFQQAQGLFEQGDFNGALQLLKQLYRAFPNHKEVIHAMVPGVGRERSRCNPGRTFLFSEAGPRSIKFLTISRHNRKRYCQLIATVGII